MLRNQSIRFKFMAALLVVLSLSIGTVLFGIWRYERTQLVHMAHNEALQAGRTIEKALRASMLQNDRQALQSAITDISQIVDPPTRISVVASNGLVAFSSQNELIGTIIDRHQEPTCVVCHLAKDTIPEVNSIMVDSEAGPLLRNVIKIVNRPECYSCHDQRQANLGILLYDANFSGLYGMLRTVAVRTVLSGLVTFAVLCVLILTLLNRLINTPIQALMEGFSSVSAGRFDHWVEIDSNDEFAEMADTFNVMSRAIMRYIGQVKTKNDEIQTLYNIVQQMSRSIEWREIKKIIVTLVCTIFQTREAILVVGEDGKSDSFEILWQNLDQDRLSHARYHLATSAFPSPLLSREELILGLDEAQVTPIFLDNQSRVLIPLLFNNRKLGIVCLVNGEGRKFSDPQIKLMPALASHISIALANARLYHMAITDSLTRLFTKRYLSETLSSMIAASDGDDSFGILLMDLDHFKEVNDSHGHPVGDEVLRQLSGVIRENIRYGDIPCRYGGEEFVVIMPRLKKETGTALDIGERLRRAVETHEFICRDNLVIKKTISVGIACYPDHGAAIEELIEAADRALYLVKESGRNQVRMAAR
jgi:diguanylate cyclase (GGDEF)-like protein